MASTRPACASEVTKATPDRPRATRSRKNANQDAQVSAVATCRPMTSRYPSLLMPVATRVDTFTTRPPSRTFIVKASAATNVCGPSLSRRVRNSCTCSSSSAAITETWDLDRPVMPKDWTSLSIRRVETPSR